MIKRISAAEFLNFDKTSSTIDLRTPGEYESEYIEGCIPLPVQELTAEKLTEALASNSQKNEPVYLLCQSGRRAEIAIEKLKAASTPELVIIEGGLNALKDAGAPIRSGKRKNISLERQVRITAGGLVMIGVVLGFLIHPMTFGISALVGAGLMFSGIADSCGMAMILAHMPWNKASQA